MKDNISKLHLREKSIRQLRTLHVTGDFIAGILTWITILLLRWYVYQERDLSMGGMLFPVFSFYTPLLLYPLWCIVVYYLSGYYVQVVSKHYLRELFETAVASLVIAVIAFFAVVIDDHVNDYHQYLTAFYALIGLQFGYTYVFRLLIHIVQTVRLHRGVLRQPIVIVARHDNPNIIKLHNDILRAKYIYDYVGVVAPSRNIYDSHQEQYIGTIEDFAALRARYDIMAAIVTISDTDDNREYYRIINLLYPHDVDISMVPRAFELQTYNTHIDTLWSNPLVKVTEVKMSDAEWCAKRFFDIVMSIAGIVVLSPLLMLCYILVRLDSPGPGFYTQERIGRHGRKFGIIKFRSMRTDAEQEGTPQLSSPNDSRITRLGRYLRKYRIDELPQLFNVLKGDMSFVGPRPEREFFIRQIMEQAPYYCLLYRIRPGITSWGPIRVGYTDTMEKMLDRLHYDIIYMEDMSLREDMKILYYTISVIINGKGQ